MKPEKWGPYFWGALHLTALGCPDAQVIRTFVECYKSVLPCISCREHFTQVLEENPVPTTEDRMVIFAWSVDVHNLVNERIGKPVIGYEEALAIWTDSRPAPVERPQFDLKISIIIILLAIIAFMIFNRK
jgi:hypothetical protein